VQFRLENDTSGYGTGTVLSQLCDNGKWHTVGFTSKGIDAAEKNYEIHNKELLSVICGLEELEEHPRRNQPQNRDPEQPLKPHILLDIPELELVTGMLVPLAFMLQLLLSLQARTTLHETR